MPVSFLVQYQLHLLSTPYLGFLVGIHRDQLQYDRFKLFEISQKRLYVKYILFFIHIDYLLACKLHKSIGICSVQRFYYIFLYSSSFCTSLLDSYRHICRLKGKSPIYYCRTLTFGANYFIVINLFFVKFRLPALIKRPLVYKIRKRKTALMLPLSMMICI